MSDQIDPAFKAAYRETQGQPVDAVGRRPIVAAQQDGGLVERLHTLAVYMDRSQHEKWCKSKTVPVHGYSGEGVLLREAAAALAEQAAQYERLAGRMDAVSADNQRLRAECEGLRAGLGRMVALYESEYDPDHLPPRPVWLQELLTSAALSRKETEDA